MFSAQDSRHMARALQLAREGRYWARPNPHVGCVLAQGNDIVGEGFTQPAGGNHAEVEALNAAGVRAAGATAYVTLEPCNHTGRTGPCSDALIRAGVGRVVAAIEDPNPAVDGSGFARLREAGIAVERGLMAAAAEREIEGFLMRMRTGRPRFRVKLAMSLDGRTAMASGESQWITGPAARADVQRLRARSCAIMTGIGTVMADDCSLTLRGVELPLSSRQRSRALAHPPARVVLDSKLQTPADARVLQDDAQTLLLHEVGAKTAGFTAETVVVDSGESGLDLTSVATELGRRQFNEILVECGPRLAGALLKVGLADELVVYIAPTLMGSSARPLLELPLDQMAQKVPLELADVRKVGDDLRLTVVPG